jgi:hypothetical protein
MNDKGRIAVRVLKRNASWPMYKPEELEECAAAPELSRNAAARRTRAVGRPLQGCLPSSDSCRAAPRPACSALREGLRLTLVTTKGPRACSCVLVRVRECARVLWVRAQSRCRCGRGRAQSQNLTSAKSRTIASSVRRRTAVNAPRRAAISDRCASSAPGCIATNAEQNRWGALGRLRDEETMQAGRQAGGRPARRLYAACCMFHAVWTMLSVAR